MLNTLLYRTKALLLGLLLASCANSQHQSESLYEQLGETRGIAGIVDALLGEMSQDRIILEYFRDSDIERFRSKLAELFCSLAEGPCEYTGDSMAQTHRGMNISHAHFNRVVEHLIRAMERRNIPTAAQNELLSRLVPMYEDVTNAGDENALQ